MKIGILSDIHDNIRHGVKAVEYFNQENIELLLFCGDFVSPFTMRLFTKLNATTKAVLGNGDPDIQKFEYQLQNLDILINIKLDISFRFQDLDIDGKRIGVVHGDDDKLIKALLDSKLYDVLCVGHTHTPKIEQIGKTLVVNPGSLVGYFIESGEVPITCAIYNTTTNKAEIIDLDKNGK